MRNMLAFAALVVIGFAVIGYHRNWYTIQTEVGPDGQRKVTVDLDNQRIGQDVHQGLKQGEQKLQTVLENSKKHAPTVDTNLNIPTTHQVGTAVQERVDQAGHRVQEQVDQFGSRVNERVDQFGNKIGERVDQVTNQVTDRVADRITDKVTSKLDEWFPKK